MRYKALLMASTLALAATPALAGPFSGNNYGDAGTNDPPPAGAILDLGGGETGTPAQTIDHGAAVSESVSFVAALTTTDITFAFREDPAFIFFGNVSLVNTTTGSSTNLIQNGNFASGSGQSPTDWTYVNVYGASAGGTVFSSCNGGLSTCWYDGAVQAYDAIDQDVTTIVGDTYTLSFSYTDNGPLTTFSDLSTNGNATSVGGNGADILAYAQAGVPSACQLGVVCTSVPEPMSLTVFGVGLFGLGVIRRRVSVPKI